MPRPPKFNILMRPVVPLVVGVLLLLIVASALMFLSSGGDKSSRSLAERSAEAFKQRLGFTPSVSINGLTVIEQTLPILELASVQQTIFREYTWRHSYLGSTKMLILRGEFLVKAGFDLKEEFLLNIDEVHVAPNTSAKQRITMRLPDAKILSVEMKNYAVVADESGWWNRITLEDRTNAVNELQREARLAAEQANIRQKALQLLQTQIADIIKDKSGLDATFIVKTRPKAQ